MSKDPAFLFYPGDYLRDTQTLSEKSQVAYDRIMCEHMRNICITKQQLKFFTKRLNEDEIEELMFTLTEVSGGFCIEWVAESITKRKAYSDSRRKNREGKKNSEPKNTSDTYVPHMENENENENEIRSRFKKPTTEEIKSYCKERGNSVDVEAFFDHYTSNGWKVGKNPMKDWKAAVRNWERTDKGGKKSDLLKTEGSDFD